MKKQSLYPGHSGRVKCLLSALALSAVLSSNAAAHLMVAQRGTLNFVGTGAFMVLSLPVSAFKGIDDDGDGKMSAAEFTKHRSLIMEAVHENVQLLDNDVPRPLHGLLLSPVKSHDNVQAPSDQLVVMGRFSLTDTPDTPDAFDRHSDLKFQVGLFGKTDEEQAFTISATRSVEPRKHKVVLTPEQSVGNLYPDTVEQAVEAEAKMQKQQNQNINN